MITATTAKNSQSDNISGRNSYHKQYRLDDNIDNKNDSTNNDDQKK